MPEHDSTVFLLAPVGGEVGLTSMALGLVRALQRDYVHVGFVKPIAQPSRGSGVDLSTHFARTVCHVSTPDPAPALEAERLASAGEIGEAMELVVEQVESLRPSCDVLVTEGLFATASWDHAGHLNAEMARSVGAQIIPVVSGAQRSAAEIRETVELAMHHFASETKLAGVLINRLDAGSTEVSLGQTLGRLDGPPVLAAVPFEPSLSAPMLSTVVRELELRVLQLGDLAQARVQEFVVAARTVENVIPRLRPGALVIAPGDRGDIAVTVGLAHLRGMPLAGLLLTCGAELAPSVEQLLRSPSHAALPILATNDDTFATAAKLSAINRHVTPDDSQRMEQIVQFVAEHVDTAPLRRWIGATVPCLSPPAFRHRLVQAARATGRRIVLPEGDEPRTVQAAIICTQKGIARCVLLGKRPLIEQAAHVKGLTLPPAIEIVDPDTVRAQYIDPMVRLRQHKGLARQQAEEQLHDNVVLGTMMLAMGEVDGLVSGARHTTANTVRPALQLIRTAPGVSIVSSVFFMLLPSEVLVYGDCAINPNPTAEELADIALQSADTATAFGIEPRVAMISYSTGTSGSGAEVEKVRKALAIAHARRPDLLIDGPMQYDAAKVESVGRQKAPDSKVAGHANVLIFPDLNTGNTTYKAVQRSANVVSIGPMLQGLRKPVNDLSRGALVDDIVYTIALTAIQAAARDNTHEAPGVEQATGLAV